MAMCKKCDWCGQEIVSGTLYFSVTIIEQGDSGPVRAIEMAGQKDLCWLCGNARGLLDKDSQFAKGKLP